MPKPSTYTAADITYWANDLDKIRARPQMYIGSTEPSAGVFTICREVLDNAVDEFQAGYAKSVKLLVSPDHKEYTIIDDGRGIPTDTHPVAGLPTLEVVLSSLQTSGKIKAGRGKAYEASIGTHGVGIKATNALSEKLSVVTKNSSGTYSISFAKGVKTQGMKKCSSSLVGGRTGTVITFSPDPEIFGRVKSIMPRLCEWASLSARLNPGLRVTIEHGDVIADWYEPDGIKSLVASMVEEQKATPLSNAVLTYSSKTLDLALAFTNADGQLIKAYTNTVANLEGGVHLTALRSALYDVLRPFLKKGQNVTPSDVLDGVIGLLNYKIAAPRFDSQTKEKLVDERVGRPCREECAKVLLDFFSKNKTLAGLIVKQAAELRAATNEFRKNKELARKLKPKRGQKLLLPDKLTSASKCLAAKRELIIVEGDGAAGSAKKARFPAFQDVYALRGKFLNAMRSTPAQLLASEEVVGILMSLGYNPDAADPVSSLRVGKVLWLADADADGAHINTLGLTLLYRLLPELFNKGMVYIVAGAEFTGTSSKGVRLYADTLDDLKAQNNGKAPKDTLHLKGWGEASPEALRELAFDEATRRLIKVLPPKDGGRELTLLMGDDVAYRKELLGV